MRTSKAALAVRERKEEKRLQKKVAALVNERSTDFNPSLDRQMKKISFPRSQNSKHSFFLCFASLDGKTVSRLSFPFSLSSCSSLRDGQGHEEALLGRRKEEGQQQRRRQEEEELDAVVVVGRRRRRHCCRRCRRIAPRSRHALPGHAHVVDRQQARAQGAVRQAQAQAKGKQRESGESEEEDEWRPAARFF